jgi:hypothetical protein
LLSQTHTNLPSGLKDFLIEYYTYTSALSMISIDVAVMGEPLLGLETQKLAQRLVESHYVGSLCGCWLELLLIIPRIYELGRHWIAEDPETNHASSPSLEHISTFAVLQREIIAWTPNPTVSQDVATAGRLFQQAVLILLYTLLQRCYRSRSSTSHALVENEIAAGLASLLKVPVSARINTSLCWPIAVIGSCVSDEERQNILRSRLQANFETIGLGNIKQTLNVLENVWERDMNEGGPWNTCHIMQDTQTWTSFA